MSGSCFRSSAATAALPRPRSHGSPDFPRRPSRSSCASSRPTACVLKEAPQRGKIGQPSVPISLNPNGAFFLGLKIGRRSSDLVLLDFLGRPMNGLHEPCRYPTPSGILDFAARAIEALLDSLPRRSRSRISGLGIAAPFELWNWEEQIGAPRAVLDGWRSFDIRQEIGRLCPWPVYFCNDATAACGAELMLGNPSHAPRFSLLLHRLLRRRRGRPERKPLSRPDRQRRCARLAAGSGYAAGSAPSQQLIRSASIYVLEQHDRCRPRSLRPLADRPTIGAMSGPSSTAGSMRRARASPPRRWRPSRSSTSRRSIIDGAFPAEVRRRIVETDRRRHRDVRPSGTFAGFHREGT